MGTYWIFYHDAYYGIKAKPKFKLPLKIEFITLSQNHSSTVYDDDIGFTFIISDNFGQSYNLRRENKLFNGFGFDSTNTGTSVPWITNNSAILTELTIQENGATEIKLTSMADSNNFVTSNINLNLGKILGFDWLTHTPGLEYGYIDEIKITSPTGESIYPSIDLGLAISANDRSKYIISDCDESSVINLGDCTLSCAPGKFEDSINPVSGYVNDDGEIQLTGCHDTLASNQKEAVERMIAEKNILHFDPNDDSTYNLDVDSKFDGSYVSKVNRYGETYTSLMSLIAVIGMTLLKLKSLIMEQNIFFLQVIVTIILNNFIMRTLSV